MLPILVTTLHRVSIVPITVLCVWGLSAARGAGLNELDTQDRARPVLLLAYDNSGDFGPQTAGTKTAGWQEALDACVRQARDLYVKGGYGGTKAIYHVTETIRFPPAQDFRVDGGVYVVNWQGPADKDLMVIDSSMNCEYHLGILVYGGLGAALRVRPEKPVPVDNFPVMVESKIEIEGLADPHPFTPGERKGGTGLVLDGSRAAIMHSVFYFASVINFRTCIETVGGFSYNEFKCPHLHSNADQSTLFRIGEGSFGNRLQLTIGVDQGAKAVTGVVLGGRRNTVELAKRESNAPFSRGRALIFADTAEGNQVNWTDADLIDLTETITDSARVPSNQVTWSGPTLPIKTIQVTGEKFIYTQRLYPATVRVNTGMVTNAILVRDSTRVDCTKAIGTGVLLSVGDRLELGDSNPALLQVIPLKTR